MSTLSEDVATYLASKGLGVLAGPSANMASEFRNSPDDLLVVRQYGGSPPEYAKNTGPILRRPRFQVFTRSKDARAAMMRAELAYKHLGSTGARTMNGKHYASVRALSEPFPTGRDENNREIIVCSYECMI